MSTRDYDTVVGSPRTSRLRGSARIRPVPVSIGRGLVLALALAVLIGVLIIAVSLWPGSGPAGRLALVVAVLWAVVFAGVTLTYEGTDLLDHVDRYRFDRDRRARTIERLEVALDADLNGDGRVGRSLPAFAKVRRGGAVIGVTTTDDGATVENGLATILDVLDAAGTVGLARSAVMARGVTRPAYDWSMDVLAALGLVLGRAHRQSGELTTDVATAKALVKRAFMSTLSIGGPGPGDVPILAQGSQGSRWWGRAARG